MNPKERLDTILAALEKLVAEHGPSYVAGAVCGLTIKSAAFADEMKRSALLVALTAAEQQQSPCQCAKCLAGRAQA